MQTEVDGQGGQHVLELCSLGFEGALMVGVGLGERGVEMCQHGAPTQEVRPPKGERRLRWKVEG